MSITVNGYTLNDVGEAEDWTPVEVALLSAFAALHPPAGTKLATTQHHHDRLLGQEAGHSVISAVTVADDGYVAVNVLMDDVDAVVYGTTGAYIRMDAAEETLFMYDNKVIGVGNDPTTPDGRLYSDGTDVYLMTPAGKATNLKLRANCSGNLHLEVASGKVNMQTVAGLHTHLYNGGVKILDAQVVDARIDDAINSGDATTDGVIDAIRDCLIAHGLCVAA
jgi:hypothetical protein